MLSLYVLLSAVLVFGSTISVDDYGAVGDGITDDTASIQSALNALKLNGGVLNFTSGKTYIISGGLDLLYYPADKSYLIQSSGKVKAVIKIKDGTGNSCGTWGMRLYDSKNITISNICLDGNRQTRNPQDETSGTSLLFIYKNCNGTRLNGLLLINSVMDAVYITAVESDSSTFMTDFEMHNCVLGNSYRNNMSIIRGKNFKIIGCEFHNASGAYSASWLQTSDLVVTKDVWHNIAVTYDGSVTKLYLDGNEVASEAASGLLSTSSSYLYIGSYSGNTYSFNGIIDDVKIYEYALSADDIKNYYNLTE